MPDDTKFDSAPVPVNVRLSKFEREPTTNAADTCAGMLIAVIIVSEQRCRQDEMAVRPNGCSLFKNAVATVRGVLHTHIYNI